MDNRLIQNWFAFRRPMPAALPLMNDVHQAARDLAHVLNQALPECADKTAAFRQLRVVVMMASDCLLRNRLGEEPEPRAPVQTFIKPPPA